MRTIELSRDGGSLSGYVVDASEPNIGNYLDQHTNLADMVTHRLRAYSERVALLRNMSVDEDQRGRGIGTQLVSAFMEEADAAGATVYMLICDTHEPQTPGFDLKGWYESFGFTAAMDTSEGPLMVMPEHLAEELAGIGRDDTHVTGSGVCGCRAPIGEIEVTGMVAWSAAEIAEARASAERRASLGQVIC